MGDKIRGLPAYGHPRNSLRLACLPAELARPRAGRRRHRLSGKRCFSVSRQLHEGLGGARNELMGGTGNDGDIQRKRPVVDIGEVKAPVGTKRRVVARLDLPQPRDPRAHLVPSLQLRVEVFDFLHERRPWADQAHSPVQDVPQLG